MRKKREKAVYAGSEAIESHGVGAIHVSPRVEEQPRVVRLAPA